MVVVNALTGDIMASRAARMPDGHLPWLQVNATLWPKTPNDLTDTQRAILIADEKQLIEKTLLQTLKEINLAR